LTSNLCGLVWHDVDKDGFYEPQDGEQTLPDIPVYLFLNDSNFNLANAIMTMMTNDEGAYCFLDILCTIANDGKPYIVLFNIPEGLTFTILMNDNYVRNNVTGTTMPLNLDCGENKTGVDAGVVTTQCCSGELESAIGGVVWWDGFSGESGAARDSVFVPPSVEAMTDDGRDLVLPGVEVRLWLNGVVIAITHTDKNGRYKFLHLRAGNYTVQVLLPHQPGQFEFVTPDVTSTRSTTDSDVETMVVDGTQVWGQMDVIVLGLPDFQERDAGVALVCSTCGHCDDMCQAMKFNRRVLADKLCNMGVCG